jgi:hypothetical protein
MNKTLVAAVAAAAFTLSSLPAAAQPDYRWQGGSNNPHWDPSTSYHDGGRHYDRRMTRDDYLYRGHDGRYYCRRNDGTTGLVAGGIGGAILGGAIGGSALATVLGGVGGAALGSSIDRGQVHCR